MLFQTWDSWNLFTPSASLSPSRQLKVIVTTEWRKGSKKPGPDRVMTMCRVIAKRQLFPTRASADLRAMTTVWSSCDFSLAKFLNGKFSSTLQYAFYTFQTIPSSAILIVSISSRFFQNYELLLSAKWTRYPCGKQSTAKSQTEKQGMTNSLQV